MAIKPLSDIVLEVAKAADPASYKTAAERLGRLAGSAAPLAGSAYPVVGGPDPVAASFAETLGGVASPRPVAPHVPFDPALALVRMQNRDLLRAEPTAHAQFEGFVLQTFIQSMLPEDSPVLFGGGTAGEIWRSMLAEGLGTHLAQAGGIGIARMLAEVHPEADGTEAPAEPAAPVCA
jgi:hypothetical protein